MPLPRNRYYKNIKFWIDNWDKIKGNKITGYDVQKYMDQENALQEYYKNHWSDFSFPALLNKATLLNSYYSTGIIDVYTLCKSMEALKFNILNEIKNRNINIIPAIAKCAPSKKNTQTKNGNISFASKFCFHHYEQYRQANKIQKANPFYIYDAEVRDMFEYCYKNDKNFRKTCGSLASQNKKPKYTKKEMHEYIYGKYDNFVKVYEKFIATYSQCMTKYNPKDNPKYNPKDTRNWDKYLWLAGKYSK